MSEHVLEKTTTLVETDLTKHPESFQLALDDVYRMRKDDPTKFSANLDALNEQLQKDGFLPQMQIVEDGEDIMVVADSKNPQGEAVVARRNHPHQSRRGRQAAHDIHYDGWRDSATGGGGAESHVPEGHRRDLIDRALRDAGVPVTRENEAAVNTIVQNESGWNPNAMFCAN